LNTSDLSRAQWHKSTYSSADGACVEVANNLPGIIAVRDSKVKDGPALIYTPKEWEAFIAGVKDGEFDLA
jgi:Domain of unknown function (DUF397)